MPTRIATNAQIQEDYGAYVEAQKPMEWGLLLQKAGRSLRRYGVSGSLRRGREWLEIRQKNRQHAEEQARISI